MKSALCAKLMTSIMPNTSVRPVDRRMRFAPTVSPMRIWVRIELSDMPPSADRPRPSRQLAARVGVGDVLQHVDDHRAQRLGLDHADVLVEDRVVVLRIEAERPPRAVELGVGDPLDQLVLV